MPKLELLQDSINFNRGATIFKSGEPATHVYVLKSGLVSICILRSDKIIELASISPNQLIGAEILQGGYTVWDYSAIAANDVELIPLSAEAARSWIECTPPLLKLFASSLLSKTANITRDTFEANVHQKDPMPCSPDRVTRLFAILYHAAAYTGSVKNGAQVVVWSAFRKYCQRGFLESPVKLEQAVFILVRLGLARLEMIPCETDPDGPEEIGFVHFTDLPKVREFYETHERVKAAPTPEAVSLASDPLYSAIMSEIEAWNAGSHSGLSTGSGSGRDKKRAAG